MPNSVKTKLSTWLDSFEMISGVRIVSNTMAYPMDETEYDQSYSISDSLDSGLGVSRLYELLRGNISGEAIEIGAGAGAATGGVILGLPDLRLFITDPSASFLRIIRNHTDGKYPTFTLTGEDVGLLPDNSLSLVYCQAALHHIKDIDLFMKVVPTKLKPGGVFIFQEPIADGYLHLITAAKLLSNLALESDIGKLIQLIQYAVAQADYRVPKVEGGDQHLFRVEYLLQRAYSNFSRVVFLKNVHLAEIGQDAGLADVIDIHSQRYGFSLLNYFRSYFEMHHKLSDEALAIFDRQVAPMFSEIDDLSRSNQGPCIVATVACVKSG